MEHEAKMTRNKNARGPILQGLSALALIALGCVMGAFFLPDLGKLVLAEKETDPAKIIPNPPAPRPLPTAQSTEDLESDPDLGLAIGLERAFQKVSNRVAPAVVSLTVFAQSSDWDENLWRMHEKLGPRYLEKEFTGSGVIIREDGTILTNEHVVRNAESIQVMLHDGSDFKARIAGTDPRSDLAVILPITPLRAKLKPAILADSSSVRKGQWALAVGNPFKLSNTLTVGVISERGRSLTTHRFFSDVFYGDLIQTDAATNPGNSGGPLFNIRGELIGINTMIYSKSGKFEGFGFAIPVNQVKPRLAYLESGQAVQYGWLGVSLKNLDTEARKTLFQLPKDHGVLVQEVFPNMPADRAGLRRGSVVISFDSKPVGSVEELIMAVGMASVGQLVQVQIMNPSGNIVEVPVRIGLRSPELLKLSRDTYSDPLQEAAKENERMGELLWRGMRVRELSEDEAKLFGGKLQIIGIQKASPADRAGLFEGAILDEIRLSGKPAQDLLTLSQLRSISQAAKGPALVHSSVVGYVNLSDEED